MSLKINHLRESLLDPIGWEHHRAPDQASDADLLWYFFPGDIEVVSDDAVLTSDVGSVPALHFVAAMIGARDALAVGDNPRYTYDFTEVDHCIIFQKVGDDVSIESNFSAKVLTAPLDQFSRGVCNFVRREIEDLIRLYPALSVRPLVNDLLRKCDGG
ncbi:hypothetical protein ACIA8G_32320 [Lentzea sp. NPDC051213]|uniref:hypothetical protein n=1 Tax=Lentzea sp. NPDC051213 TaxID=3364126 RepID=UPI0037A60341